MNLTSQQSNQKKSSEPQTPQLQHPLGGRGREARLAEVIRAVSPDLVVFQEATDPVVIERLASARILPTGPHNDLTQSPTSVVLRLLTTNGITQRELNIHFWKLFRKAAKREFLVCT